MFEAETDAQVLIDIADRIESTLADIRDVAARGDTASHHVSRLEQEAERLAAEIIAERHTHERTKANLSRSLLQNTTLIGVLQYMRDATFEHLQTGAHWDSVHAVLDQYERERNQWEVTGSALTST